MGDGLANRAWRAITGGGGAAGAANAIPKVIAGIAQSVWANLGTFLQNAGVTLTLAPMTATMPEKAGVAVTGSYTGSSTPAQSAGVAQSVTANLGTPAQSPGAQIVQITYNLVQTTGAIGATSTGSWTNPANAEGAQPDSVKATNANTVTVAASGSLVLTYAAQPNKTPLTINSVILYGYWSNAAGAVGPCTYLFEYSLNNGATWTTITTGSGTIAAGSPTWTTDITAAVGGSWTKVAQLQVRATYTGASSATASTLSVDCYKMVVLASATQAP